MQCNPPLRFSGEAIYEIGVEDNGLMTGLSDEDMDSSLDTLREMARRLGATIQVLRERVVTTEHGTRTVSEVLVRKVDTLIKILVAHPLENFRDVASRMVSFQRYPTTSSA